jgi:hypothetical protein
LRKLLDEFFLGNHRLWFHVDLINEFWFENLVKDLIETFFNSNEVGIRPQKLVDPVSNINGSDRSLKFTYFTVDVYVRIEGFRHNVHVSCVWSWALRLTIHLWICFTGHLRAQTYIFIQNWSLFFCTVCVINRIVLDRIFKGIMLLLLNETISDLIKEFKRILLWKKFRKE